VDLTWETAEADKNEDFVMVAFRVSDYASECVRWVRNSKSRVTSIRRKRRAPASATKSVKISSRRCKLL
jgi:hypothetical protein